MTLISESGIALTIFSTLADQDARNLTSFTIRRDADLYKAKHFADLDEVVIETARLKTRNLLRHALKYALWAARPGGRIIVRDDGPASFKIAPFTTPFSIVRQQVMKVLGPQTDVLSVSDERFTIELVRTEPPLANTWSAGVVISGAEAEKPVIDKALTALFRQPELRAENRGQVLVCGPAEGRALLAGWKDVEYVEFPNSTSGRIPICAKKNALLAAVRNAKVAILHARIALADGCLAALPREFDVTTPRVVYDYGGRPFAYDDWIVTDALDGEGQWRHWQTPNWYDRTRYLSEMRRGRPFVVGSLFMARTDLARRVPLNEDLAWGEAEDMEWCARLHAAGALVDLAPEAVAETQTFKWSQAFLDRPDLTTTIRKVGRPPRAALLWARNVSRR